MASSSLDPHNPVSRGRTSVLPLDHPERMMAHDAKMLQRELMAADARGEDKLLCRCNDCKGLFKSGKKIVKKHLSCNGRHPACRIWRGEGADSSDEEWSEKYLAQCGQGSMGATNLTGMSEGAVPVVMGISEVAMDPNLGIAEVAVDLDPRIAEATLDPNSGMSKTVDPPLEPEIQVRRLLDEALQTMEDIGTSDDLDPFDLDDLLASGEVLVERQASEDGDVYENEASGLHEQAFRPLFNGSRTDLLSFLLQFLSTCHKHGISNNGVNALLQLLDDKVLPAEHCLPKNMYGAKKVLQNLGLSYEKISVCEDNCVLFRGEYKDLMHCPTCGKSKMKKVGPAWHPKKVLRYFPIIPRLKRLYSTRDLSKLMTWHHKNKSTDEKVRHVADSKAWKHVDTNIDPDFAAEPRNVRFGLALDGVNPFGNNSTSWSTWPILLLNYNLPPWLTTKNFFIQLALLIPGPQSVTEKELDMFMAPLMEDLLVLWNVGVWCVDALSRPGRPQQFLLRACCLWTINDYPAYGLISGQQYSGYKGCVVCGPNCESRRSEHLKKNCYEYHRRYLPKDHTFRLRANAKYFDGKVENREPPPRISSIDRQCWGEATAAYLRQPGKKLDDVTCPVNIHGVKRACCLYQLPYWNKLLINHCLDPMHIEKNLAHNLIHTIIGTKDTEACRDDMEELGVRRHLWRKLKKDGKKSMPHAPYCMTKAQYDKFLRVLLSLKSPTGFGSSLAKCVSVKKKLSGLKSHDYHQLMQQVLPMAVSDLMDEGPTLVIGRLSNIWRKICTKVWDPTTYASLREEVVFTLCILEMHFPHSFFDVMTHLMVHVVEELDICGPVSARWMYPVERHLKVLKGYVRSKARPEASMAEGYILNEALGFASELLIDAKGGGKRTWELEEDPGASGVVLQGAAQNIRLSWDEMIAMHHTFLENELTVVRPWYRIYDVEKAANTLARTEFRKEWRSILRQARLPVPYPADMVEIVSFQEWFKHAIQSHEFEDRVEGALLLAYSNPPSVYAKSYKSCTAFGNHWRAYPSLGTLSDCDSGGYNTFDSGMAGCWTETRTNNRGKTTTEDFQYVGVLTDIVVLDYGYSAPPIVLFKGKWGNHTWSKKKDRIASNWRDQCGLWQANFKQQLRASAKLDYVLPSQVEQVFFHPNRKGDAWRTVLHKEARSIRVMGTHEGVDYTDDVVDNVMLHVALAKASLIQPTLEKPTEEEPTEEVQVIEVAILDEAMVDKGVDKIGQKRKPSQKAIGRKRK